MKKFFGKIGYKLQNFMSGRYGFDRLNRALLIFYLIIIIIANILYRYSKVSYYALVILAAVLIIFSIYRSFSKNIEMRRSENAGYLKFIGKITGWFKFQKEKFKQRKTHKFVKCKKCRKALRLPKHKGKLNVTCPHCGNQFIVKTGKKK